MKIPLAALLLASSLTAHAQDRSWDFEVRLDDKAIGNHRFTVTPQGDGYVMKDTADFTVKFLGFTAYRYHHEDTEQWRAGCLVSMDANTSDDGKPARVQARLGDGKLQIEATGAAEQAVPGCVMSFAYWEPALRKAGPTRLLNAQNGRIESVQIKRLEDGQVEVRGAMQPAQHWRITSSSPKLAPIDLWYSADGSDWLGLDSTVRGTHALQYRRQQVTP